MLNNLLKLSVSSVILLGLIGTKDSSFAMERPEEDKTRPQSFVVNYQNKQNPDLTNEDDHKKSITLASGQIFSNELLLHIFSFLDYKTQLTAEEVCHLWHSLIEDSLPNNYEYANAFLKKHHERKEFDRALSFLCSFHSKHLNIWENYAYDLVYELKQNFNSPTLIDPSSIKNFIESFSTFFPQKKKTKNIFNLSLGCYPQYYSKFLCFLNLPIENHHFGQGINFLNFSFSNDVEAWKTFANYFHEFWCDYDQKGNLISTKKDEVCTYMVKQFIQIFTQKFPDAQEHPSIVSLSHASSFDSEGHEEP